MDAIPGARGDRTGFAGQERAVQFGPAVEDDAVHRALRRRVLPFELGRQPRAGPARVGVCLVATDVADRIVGLPALQAVQGEFQRFAIALLGKGRAVVPMTPARLSLGSRCQLGAPT